MILILEELGIDDVLDVDAEAKIIVRAFCWILAGAT